MVGKNERYGLPEPEHRIMDTHPTMTTVLPQLVGHGRIWSQARHHRICRQQSALQRRERSRGRPRRVSPLAMRLQFRSSTTVSCSGLTSRPLFYLNVFHPELDDLFAVGLIQANGSIWRLADDQSKLVASYLIAMAERHERADWFKTLKRQGHASMVEGSYVKSDRHRLEANYYAYRRKLKRHLRRFGPMATATLKSGRTGGSALAPHRAGYPPRPSLLLSGPWQDRFGIASIPAPIEAICGSFNASCMEIKVRALGFRGGPFSRGSSRSR
jgi:hypothetical protein